MSKVQVEDIILKKEVNLIVFLQTRRILRCQLHEDQINKQKNWELQSSYKPVTQNTQKSAKVPVSMDIRVVKQPGQVSQSLPDLKDVF